MSNITHQDELVTKAELSQFYQGIYPYLNGSAHAGFTPVGTIISVMGVSAPTNYLACNGQIVNIADYPELSTYFEQQFGTKNYFGGDGTTTFAVPDLRGEFLRGTGTNSHANQGNGADVGMHQDGTVMDLPISYNNVTIGVLSSNVGKGFYNNSSQLNLDSISTSSGHMLAISANKFGPYNDLSSYTSRPTNTSVLYCIATKNIYIDARSEYSISDEAYTEIEDTDYFPTYNTSETKAKKTLWSNIKTVLKNFFDSLYQPKLTAGNNINIKNNVISANHVYSTTERPIGTWIDGKTLYQLTIVLAAKNITSNTWTTIYTNAIIGKIDTLVDGAFTNGAGNVYGDMNYRHTGNNLQLNPRAGGVNYLAGATVTIRYTKTTN